MSEQRINIKFLVKLEKMTHLQHVSASTWRQNMSRKALVCISDFKTDRNTLQTMKDLTMFSLVKVPRRLVGGSQHFRET